MVELLHFYNFINIILKINFMTFQLACCYIFLATLYVEVNGELSENIVPIVNSQFK